jgi:hypothetical protein
MANHGYFAGQILRRRARLPIFSPLEDRLNTAIKKARRSAGPFQIPICSN